MPILAPRQTWSILPATQAATVPDHKVLIVGQMTSAGSATSGALNQDIQDNTNQINALFGQDSHIAGMIRRFKKQNKVSQLDAIALDDAVGTPAESEIDFTGSTATEAGRLQISVMSEKDHKYALDIADTDDATAIGDALVALITADANAPFSAVNAVGVVTITFSQDGTLANELSLKVAGTVAGVTAAITGWSTGATDPTLTNVLDVIGNIQYGTIVWPSAYDITVVEDVLNARFNTAYVLLDGMAIQVKKGTATSLKSYASQNSQSVCIVGNKTVSKSTLVGTAIVESPDIIASEIAAYRALRLTKNALLTPHLTTVAGRDQFGGPEIATLPYFNSLMVNLIAPDQADEFTLVETEDLETNGVSILGANRTYNGVILGQMVTTYLNDNAGNPDTSYMFLNRVDTSSVIRQYFYENIRKRYGQSRLTNGDLLAERDMANEPSIRAYCISLYDDLADMALTQAGNVARKDFNNNLLITLDLAAGSATLNMAPLLVSQLRVVLGTIKVNLGS